MFSFCSLWWGNGTRSRRIHGRPGLPKLGPSLLIATCLILAIRTAKWPAHTKQMLSDSELDPEVHFAEYLAKKVLSRLMSRNEAIFPQRRQPWCQPDGKDCPE